MNNILNSPVAGLSFSVCLTNFHNLQCIKDEVIVAQVIDVSMFLLLIVGFNTIILCNNELLF